MPYRNPVKFRAKLGVFAAFAIFAFAAFWGGSASVSQNVAASAFGPTTGHTGAPGEMNCTACHTTFPVNSGKGNVTISGLPLNYLPGQQIPVTVTVSDP